MHLWIRTLYQVHDFISADIDFIKEISPTARRVEGGLKGDSRTVTSNGQKIAGKGPKP